MNREKFIKEFQRELVFLSMLASRDLEKNYTLAQVEDGIVKSAASLYGSRLDFDMFATNCVMK